MQRTSAWRSGAPTGASWASPSPPPLTGSSYPGEIILSCLLVASFTLYRDPWEMLRDGDFTNVEIMIGTNQDEGIYI